MNGGGTLLGRPSPPGDRWVIELGVAAFPWLADHRIQGTIVVPGTMYVELALAAATAVRGRTPGIVEDIAFERALVVPPDEVRALEVTVAADGDALRFVASGAGGIRHASARLRDGCDGARAERWNLADPLWAQGTEIAGEVLYRQLRELGNDYGPAFRRIATCTVRDRMAVAVFQAPVTDGEPGGLRRIAVLDAAMHVLAAVIGEADHSYALVGCERLAIHAAPGASGRVHARVLPATGDSNERVGDVVVVDDAGRPVAELRDVRIRCLPLPRARRPAPAQTTLAVTATFTAEPLRHALAFWLDALGIPATVEFASNQQPVQQLLDRTSLLSTNTRGANVILVRWEDLAGRRSAPQPSGPGASLGAQPTFTVPGVGEIAQLAAYETEFLHDEIFVRQSYLRHGIELCDGACVFDVGANIGLFTLFVHSQCDNPRVYAFEPSPPAFDVLQCNASVHCPTAMLFPCGVAAEATERPFTFYRRSPAFSNFAGDTHSDRAAVEAIVRNVLRARLPAGVDLEPLLDELVRGRLDSEIYRCRTTTLSSVIRDHAIASIDLLKIDAEGSESDVLVGIDDEHWPRIRQIVAEVHDRDDCERLRADLERRGFRVVVDSAGALLRGTGFAHLFARRAEPASVARRTRAWARSLEANAADLSRAVEAMRQTSSVPCIVVVCPPSDRMRADGAAGPALERLDHQLADALAGIPDVAVVTPAALARSYPVPGYASARAEALGRIPYTSRFFAALATMIARRFVAFQRPPIKVLALDCDNTLWRGVCGEDGPSGITVDAGRRALQELAIRQHDAGVLICLCSKNHPDDVLEVFAQRSDMPLALRHVAASRFNWNDKSGNLASLARELELGLDSFAFLDDDPVECAAVRANLPEVLTLCVPRADEDIAPFLAHVWAFDPRRPTAEDSVRIAHHHQEQERRALRASALTFASFLAGLDLHVTQRPHTRTELARVAQLTQRTNQFTSTGLRRSEAELQALTGSGALECWTVRVEDRFGDYGLVGAALFRVADGALRVDGFLLSCRALGRGVEHRMLAALSQIARDRGLDRVEIAFVPTGRNEPARRFFASVSNASSVDGGLLFTTATDAALRLTFDPADPAAIDDDAPPLDPAAPVAGRAAPSSSLLDQRIATELHDVDAIVEHIERARTTRRPALRSALAGPNDELERKLVALWRQVLAVDEVGIDDNFFELGGTSLLAVDIMARLTEHTGSVMAALGVFEHTTIRAMAAMLRYGPDPAGLSGQRRGERRRAIHRSTVRRNDDA